MSKNNKGMICFLHWWEWNDKYTNGQEPDCRNHQHLSKRRAFERFGSAQYADRTLAQVVDQHWRTVGLIVEVAGEARWCEKIFSGFQGSGKITPGRVNTLVRRTVQAIGAGQRAGGFIRLLTDDQEEYGFW